MIAIPRSRSAPSTPRRMPLLLAEARRDEYVFTVWLRNRRSWYKLTAEERHKLLLDSARQLEEYAAQMREEASTLP